MSRKWPRLLIVDDCPDVLRFVIRKLKSEFEDTFSFGDEKNYGRLGLNGEVVGALDGNVALRVLHEDGPFDVVLTDLRMFHPSGLQLLGRIRSGETEHESHGTPRNVLVGAYSAAIADYDCSEFDFIVHKSLHTFDLLPIVLLKALVPIDSTGTISRLLTPLTLERVILPQLTGEHEEVRLTLSDASFLRMNETGQIVYLDYGLAGILVNDVFKSNKDRQKKQFDCVSLEANRKTLHRISYNVSYRDFPPFRIDIELPKQKCFICQKLSEKEETKIKLGAQEAIAKAFTSGKVERIDEEFLELGFVLTRDVLTKAKFV